MTANTQKLINAAQEQARYSNEGALLLALADDLHLEATDRVHAEEALRRYGNGSQEEQAAEFYDDTLQVTANLDTIGVISLTLPIRLADESGAPDIVRAFDLARDIVDAAAGLAAEDEAKDADVITLSPRDTATRILRLMDTVS